MGVVDLECDRTGMPPLCSSEVRPRETSRFGNPIQVDGCCSTAYATKSDGIGSPIILAVCKFNFSANFAGCWIGRSP
jgi:hypothetical protein